MNLEDIKAIIKLLEESEQIAEIEIEEKES